jgi:hypothetical protein
MAGAGNELNAFFKRHLMNGEWSLNDGIATSVTEAVNAVNIFTLAPIFLAKLVLRMKRLSLYYCLNSWQEWNFHCAILVTLRRQGHWHREYNAPNGSIKCLSAHEEKM